MDKNQESALFFARQSTVANVGPKLKLLDEKVVRTLAKECDSHFYLENQAFDAEDYAINILLNEDVAKVTQNLEQQQKIVDGLIDEVLEVPEIVNELYDGYAEMGELKSSIEDISEWWKKVETGAQNIETRCRKAGLVGGISKRQKEIEQLSRELQKVDERINEMEKNELENYINLIN